MEVVIGAGFGDEGKGLMTDYLASRYGRDALVVRFNGGAQAGHTVETNYSQRHVFRHIGSGTFSGASTYLSQFFVANPILFLEEVNELHRIGIKPKVYVDPNCFITTPYDMMINQIIEEARGDKRHGSCGVGFSETIERNQHPNFSIKVSDLENKDRLTSTLQSIRTEWLRQRLWDLEVYEIPEKWQSHINSDEIFSFFIQNIESFLQLITITQIDLTNTNQSIIFEGAQGLMLDQERGWFPYVTRSNTGLKNVLELIKGKANLKINVNYVTRCYSTRHGAGPLPNELPEAPYKKISDKTNIHNNHQGSLRFAWLNLSLLKFFIQQDMNTIPSLIKSDYHLVVTCLDQVDDQLSYILDEKIYTGTQDAFLKKLSSELGMTKLVCSYGPTKDNIFNLNV